MLLYAVLGSKLAVPSGLTAQNYCKGNHPLAERSRIAHESRHVRTDDLQKLWCPAERRG